MGETFLDRFAVLVASFAFGCCRFMACSFFLEEIVTIVLS